MLAISRLVLRHKLVIGLFWIAVLAAGAFASAHLSGRLSGQFALPGARSYQANKQILRVYGNGGDGYPEVVVVTLPSGEPAVSAAGRMALSRAFGGVAATRGLRVADYASTGNRAFLTSDPRMSYGLVFTPFSGELRDRAVPRRPDRARRGDRLLAAAGHPLARGTGGRPRRRAGGGAGNGHSRAVGGI